MPEIWERVSPTQQAYTYDLGLTSPGRRLDVWRDLMSDRSLGTVQRADKDGFQGTIDGQAFRGGVLARWTISQQILVRTPDVARRLDDEYVFVSAMIDGRGAHEQGNEVFDLNAGDFTIVDATRAFNSVTASATSTKGFLHIHKAALRQRLGSRVDAAFGVYRAGSPLQKLAFSFLRDLTGLVGHVDPATLTTLAGQALDVIALLVEECRPAKVEQSTHKSAMLLRLKDEIRTHLRDAGYTLDAAAAALGVTPRYVNALLGPEGTSFGRYLLEARLQAARRDLVDPRNIHRQITEIAFDWGFNNASHFGKAFKDRFDMTPREAKAFGAFSAIKATGR